MIWVSRTQLSKWLFKLLTSDGTWQQILRNEYLGSKLLSQVEWKARDSHFWSGLMKVKQAGISTLRCHHSEGWVTNSFWEDICGRVLHHCENNILAYTT